MKKLMMIAVMAVVALTANAQNTLRDNGSFTLQPKVGIGIGSLDGTWTTAVGVDRKSRIGFLAGAEAEYYTNEWLGIAAGLNYAQQGWKFEGGGTSTTYKLDYLFLLSAKEESLDIKDAYESVNFSIPIGLSYEYENFVFDARYNIGVSTVNKNSTSDNKYHSGLVQFTIGYKFQL